MVSKKRVLHFSPCWNPFPSQNTWFSDRAFLACCADIWGQFCCCVLAAKHVDSVFSVPYHQLQKIGIFKYQTQSKANLLAFLARGGPRKAWPKPREPPRKKRRFGAGGLPPLRRRPRALRARGAAAPGGRPGRLGAWLGGVGREMWEEMGSPGTWSVGGVWTLLTDKQELAA